MDALILEWVSLLLRWLHVITGIAWIGASFYFVWLDNNLEHPPQWKQQKGIAGDLWAFHGGGIYEVGKYTLAPEKMPTTLHWFKWEAYSTWISGTLLLIALYYVQADLYLVGQNRWLDNPLHTVLASIVFLISGVAIYELILRSQVMHTTAAVIGLFACFIALFSWLSVKLFSDRAAFLHVGALLASIMAANVLLGIIPAQKGFMKAVEAGKTPDKSPMLKAKTRSIHNNYFTLPVLFCMISNHYAFVYGHRFSWLILVAIVALSAYARHFFNLRHRGVTKPSILLTAAGGVLLLIGLMAWDQKKTFSHGVDDASSAQALMPLVTQHCTVCHAVSPTQPGFSSAPAGLLLEDKAQVVTAKNKIHSAVSTGYMPLGNITGMTEEEKRLLLKSLERL